MNLRFAVIVCMSMLLLQCGGGEHKPVTEEPRPTVGQTSQPQQPQTGPPSGDGAPAYTGPTFEDVKPVFESKCQACHVRGSGLPVWTNYVDAFSKSGRIHDRTLVKKDMPPAGTPQLSAEELALIDEWIENGSPETPQIIAHSGDGAQNQDQVSPPIQGAVDGRAVEGDGATTMSAPSPVVLPEELTGTKIYCRNSEKHPTGGVAKNRYFSAILGEDLLSSRVYSTTVHLDLFGRIQTTENIGYLKSLDRTTMEICHSAVLDYYRCAISKKIVRIDYGEVSIDCGFPHNSTTLSIRVWGGRGIVQCHGPDVHTEAEYRNCRITE